MCENSVVKKKRIEPQSTWDFVGVTNLSSQKDSNWYNMFLRPHLASYRIALQTPGGWFLLTLEESSPFFSFHTVDGRNPAPPGMVLKPCKSWDKLPTSTGAGFPAINGIFPVSHLICCYFSFFTAWYVFHGVMSSITTTEISQDPPVVLSLRKGGKAPWQWISGSENKPGLPFPAYPGHSEFPQKW